MKTEIIREIDENCEGFSELESITKDTLLDMVGKVETLVNKTHSGADSTLRQIIEGQFTSIDSDGQQTDIPTFFATIRSKIESNFRSR